RSPPRLRRRPPPRVEAAGAERRLGPGCRAVRDRAPRWRMRANNGTLHSLLSINQTATRFEAAPNVTTNLALVSSPKARSSAPLPNGEYTAGVAWFGNEDGAFMEPGGCNRRQAVANAAAPNRPETSQNRRWGLRPVAETSRW